MEKELKIIIHTEKDFQKLLKKLPDYQKTVFQTNYYWDTKDFQFLKNSINIRIRFEDSNNPVITVKHGNTINNGYFIADEYESEYTGLEKKFEIGEKLDLQSLSSKLSEKINEVSDSSSLICLGSLKTIRRLYKLNCYKIELDHVFFPEGNEDYELEVETNDIDNLRPLIKALFKKLSVIYSNQSQTKYQRFLKHINR